MADKITEDDLPEDQVAHLNDMAATYQTWREAETRFKEQLAAGRDMKPPVPFSLITEKTGVSRATLNNWLGPKAAHLAGPTRPTGPAKRSPTTSPRKPGGRPKPRKPKA